MAVTPVLMPLSTIATDPVRNFRFLVTFKPQTISGTSTGDNVFDPKSSVGFVGVSGLNVAIESIAYREGGYNTTMHQFPGQTSFQPISFTRGVILGTNQHHNWTKELFTVISGNSQTGVGKNFRCDIDIDVLSHPNPAELSGSDSTTHAAKAANLHVAMRFRVYNAWINSLSYGDLSAGGNDLMVESMSVVHEGWDMVWADPDYLTATGASAKSNNGFVK
jgi:phage tail-like protein